MKQNKRFLRLKSFRWLERSALARNGHLSYHCSMQPATWKRRPPSRQELLSLSEIQRLDKAATLKRSTAPSSRCKASNRRQTTSTRMARAKRKVPCFCLPTLRVLPIALRVTFLCGIAKNLKLKRSKRRSADPERKNPLSYLNGPSCGRAQLRSACIRHCTDSRLACK